MLLTHCGQIREKFQQKTLQPSGKIKQSHKHTFFSTLPASENRTTKTQMSEQWHVIWSSPSNHIIHCISGQIFFTTLHIAPPGDNFCRLFECMLMPSKCTKLILVYEEAVLSSYWLKPSLGRPHYVYRYNIYVVTKLHGYCCHVTIQALTG